jgi:hypothetical protein
MRHSLGVISLFALSSAIAGRGDDVLPAPSNFDRYSAMVDRSPFAVATAMALPAVAPDFAKDLYLANAAHSADADLVTVASSSDRSFKKYLTSLQPVDGYRIESVEWSDRVGASKVTISKDGKFATLTFNEALLSQRTAPNGPLPPAQSMSSQSPPSMQTLDPPKAFVDRGSGGIQRKPGAIPTPNPTPISPQLPDPPSLKSSEQRHQERFERRRQLKSESLRPVAPTQSGEEAYLINPQH